MNQRTVIFLLTASLSLSSFANCPEKNVVVYNCIIILNQKHCAWSAPWYEGFPETAAQQNDHAASFSRAFWSTSTGTPPISGNIGSSVCFYKSSYGNEIILVQNFWGNVDYPAGNNWTLGVWGLRVGKQCVDSVAKCNFNYP